MAFDIYPDADVAGLLNKPANTPISLAASEPMRKFLQLPNHVGADPTVGNMPTTFISVAVSGAALRGGTHPKFELLAHDPDRPGGSAAQLIDPNTAVSPATGITLYDDINRTGAALAYFAPPFRDNVYLLKAVMQIAGTRVWIRITNTTAGVRDLVWVVADNAEDTRQPWIHASLNGSLPVEIRFDAEVGEPTAAQPITIRNFGTAPFSVAAVRPAVASPYILAGLPLSIASNASANLSVGFNTPGAPGDVPADVFSLVTSNKTDPGPFGQGHNDQFILSARTVARPSNVWVTKSPMPTDRGAFGLVGAANGKLYAMGGIRKRVPGEPIAYLDLVEEYDPTTDRWSTKEPMPSARIAPRLACADNGKIYALGGFHSVGSVTYYLRNVEEYDPVRNSWTTKQELPVYLLKGGVAAAANGKVYYVGNGGWRGEISYVGEYDPVTNVWTNKASMPTSRTEFGLAAAGNGKIYAAGGFADQQDQMRVLEEFDPVFGNWQTKRPMPVGTRGPGLAAARGKLYVMGGLSTSGNSSTIEYDPATEQWSLKEPMPGARWSFQSASLSNGKIYAMGSGENGVLATTLVEYTA